MPGEPVDPTITVENGELLSPRDFRREFAPKLERLASGELEKLVLMNRGKMVAVVLPLEAYAELLKRADGG